MDFAGLLNRQEELDPELAPYRHRDSRLGWDCIKHPLVFSVPHSDELNAFRIKEEGSYDQT